MTGIQKHMHMASSAEHLLTGRFSRHPERYAEILRIARKYELHHVLAELRAARSLPEDDDDDTPTLPVNVEGEHHAEGLASALEELGPCFIKLGQILSTRPDILPQNYIDALSRLQDSIRPVSGDKIVHIVQSELGAPIGELFRSFEHQPLATASMAQVHRAVLPDGSDVAVKVQRPGVRERIEVDIEVLYEMARFLTRYTSFGTRYDLIQMVHELEDSLGQELDFRLEADNTRLIGRHLADFPSLVTPTVYPAYTSRRVLTLSFVHGRHLPSVPRQELNSLDTPRIARDLLSAYLQQIVIDGIFHCDPHPGNIFLTEDAHLALLDFGMVGRFDSGEKDQIILLLLAFSERQGERVADTYLEMIEIPKHFNRRAFTQDVGALVSRYHDMSGGRMALGTALLDLTKVAYAHHTPVPSVMTLLGKAMLNLDGTIRVLSPELDPVQLIRDYMLDVMQKRVLASFSPGRMFAWVLDAKHLFENTPRRADMILNKLANDQLTVRLEVDNLDEAMRSVSRAANQLSLGMILGSLIIGGGYVLASTIRGDGAGQGRRKTDQSI